MIADFNNYVIIKEWIYMHKKLSKYAFKNTITC